MNQFMSRYELGRKRKPLLGNYIERKIESFSAIAGVTRHF